MRRCIALLFALALTTALSAQDYHVEVRLVEIEVRVTDRNGAPVPDLTRADFTLKEDGVAHDVATAQFLPPFETGRAHWETDAGTLAEPVAPPPVSPTWIYIASEVGPTDVPRAESAIRSFLLNNLQPGFKVSLGGRAFTDDRSQLLGTLNQLARAPIGAGGRPGLVDVAWQMGDDVADERAAAATVRRQTDGTAPMAGFMARPEELDTDASQARPYMTMGRADRQLPVYGDVRLNQYYDIVERLAQLPGKKAVVLMRPGLRLEPSNQGLMQDLASFAVRRRVSFYTVDSRGLNNPIPGDERPIPFTIDRRRRPGEPDVLGQNEMRSLERSGLDNLARETGGRSLIGTNRLGEIFEKMAEDASGYYVLSYYPVDLRQAGRFRTVKVDVTRPGVRVQQTTRGYYESRPQGLFTKDDRGVALRRAMQMARAPVDLPMAATVGLFASDEGFPVLVLSAGVPASALEPRKEKGAYELAATAIVRVADADRQRLPMYFERRLDAPLESEALDRVRADRTAFIAMTDLLPLLPGDYEWRIVFRDERTGKMGGADGKVSLKDFRAESTPSTLLLTRQVVRRGQDGSPELGADRQPLDVGGLRFAAQPAMAFHRGEIVRMLYTLYNATRDDVTAARRGMQVAIYQGRKPITDVKVFGEPVIDEGRNAIQYTGGIDTRSLAPGLYTVVGMLPNFEARAVKHVEQRFLLIEPLSGS